MALVTDISMPQRGSRRRLIVVDGEPYRVTSADVVRALGLRAGSIESIDELRERLDATEPRIARERALRLLGYRDRSAADLHARLTQDGFADGVAADVVADLMHAALVDDERFAANAARTLTRVRGLGRFRALRELAAAGLDPQVAEAAVDASLTPEEEAEAARALARALASRPGTDADRIIRRLVRRGYPLGVATHVAREALARAGEGDAPSDLPVCDD